jgi:6-phosphofructokinase 2
MKTIVTLTPNPAIDKSTVVDRILPEHKLRCDTPKFEAGGGGINVSKAIKRLDGESLAIFPSGGPTGIMLEGLLKEEGVTYQTVPIQNWTRENFIVVESSTNGQFRFGLPGPDMTVGEGQACLDALLKVRTKPDYIVASGSLSPGLPLDFFAQVARIAKQLGSRFILDTSGEPLQLAVNEGVYLLKPNLGELSKLAGMESLEMEMVDDVAQEIISKGSCEVMVVSLGPSGALLVTKDGYTHVPAPSVKKKSTVGAGDSMVAGMTWSLAQSKSLQEMVRFGVACGTAATMNSGTELFRKADVDKLYHWICTYSNRYVMNFENR